MSKAFTRELDDAPERVLVPRASASLPPGVKNYITPDGEKALREELESLGAGGKPEDAALEQRLLQIREILASAVVAPIPPEGETRVRFGARVTVRDARETVEYRIVGVDEADIDRNWISWRSPLATALLNKQPGDRVSFRAPAGEQRLEILRVSYS